MDTGWIGVLVQGGAVSIALVALWVIYKVVTNHFVHTNDVIEKNAESNTKLAVALNSLEKTIKDN